MARCRSVRGELTAWVDGEISERWNRKIQDHLIGCKACAAEAQSLRLAVASHSRALSELVGQDMDVSALLWVRIDARAEEAESPKSTGWLWLRPALVVSAVVLLSLVGLVSVTGGPERVLIPLGVKAPPPVVRRAPEMFTQYRMIEKLDMLENFDTVDAVQIDDGETEKG